MSEIPLEDMHQRDFSFAAEMCNTSIKQSALVPGVGKKVSVYRLKARVYC